MSLNPHDGPTRRLFFALWPDEGIREELDRVSRHAVRKRGKRVRGENLHITLAFIGQVPADTASCLRQAAAEIRGQRFTLRLDRIGYWPRPRILWLGPSHTPAALRHLVGDLNRQLGQECGYTPEKRPWQAHVTLARKCTASREEPTPQTVDWAAGHFSMVESVTDPAGARYRVLDSWPLLEAE